MYQELLRKEKTLAVIGLGYVGLPIALLFAKKIKVIGFDINAKRVEMMRAHKDPSGELKPEEFTGCDIEFTADIEDLRRAHFFVVAVPTPIDRHNKPDLTPVIKASETISKVLKAGDYVVYESTVYPGCTEEDCVPILERSGLKAVTDFKIGYSPERINPGDQHHKLADTIKIVSGCDAESLQEIYDVYKLAITAELHRAPTIKVAEAAKIIENTQRDLNIALMNELSIIFNKMGINTYDVIEAAGTKWNFHRYQPGLVGGHCIGVDPYYLTYKAAEIGYHSKVITAGRETNDSMGQYIGGELVKRMVALGKNIRDTRVLVMGATFKEDVQDIRNSKVFDLVKELIAFGVNVDVIDPHADAEEVEHEYRVKLSPGATGKYDGVIVAVAHAEYKQNKEAYYQSISTPDAILVDLKGLHRNEVKHLAYWSL
jgi:UDP-N-acetyl-D-glucosamine/UDP-N-acetyl-D-galactosamine dehydrogenase